MPARPDLTELERLLTEATEDLGHANCEGCERARELAVGAVNALPALLAERETLREALREIKGFGVSIPAPGWEPVVSAAVVGIARAALEGASDEWPA